MTEELLPRPTGEDTDSDAALLLLIEKGDEEAMAMLYKRHSRMVYAIGLRVLRDAAQAEDLLQEVFMQVWKKPLSLDASRGRFSSYLAVVTRNRAVDVLRGRKQDQLPEAFDVASSFDLAEDSERRLILDRVREVAGQLPVEQRNVLNLAFFEGLTHTEIAQKTNTPLGTVKTRIRSALMSLERTLAV